MPSLDLPRRLHHHLLEVAAKLIQSRKPRTEHVVVAHELLATFHDTCMRAGLDGLLEAIGQEFPGVDVADRTSFFDGPLTPALTAQLATFDLDDGSPRNAKPAKLADSVTTALHLNVVDDAPPVHTLDGSVRAAAAAAIAKVIESELAAPRMRAAIIAHAQPRIEERYFVPFEKLTAMLDDRGLHIMRQLKLPVDAVHAVEHVLTDAREAVIGGAASTAIDRARDVIAAASPEAAALIDQPMSLRLTPRQAAILRVLDRRLVKLPEVISASLLESLGELARIGWRAPERIARPYAATATFSIGDLVEHPKFGKGTVTGTKASRVDIEFADTTRTLVHVPAK